MRMRHCMGKGVLKKQVCVGEIDLAERAWGKARGRAARVIHRSRIVP